MAFQALFAALMEALAGSAAAMGETAAVSSAGGAAGGGAAGGGAAGAGTLGAGKMAAAMPELSMARSPEMMEMLSSAGGRAGPPRVVSPTSPQGIFAGGTETGAPQVMSGVQRAGAPMQMMTGGSVPVPGTPPQTARPDIRTPTGTYQHPGTRMPDVRMSSPPPFPERPSTLGSVVRNAGEGVMNYYRNTPTGQLVQGGIDVATGERGALDVARDFGESTLRQRGIDVGTREKIAERPEEERNWMTTATDALLGAHPLVRNATEYVRGRETERDYKAGLKPLLDAARKEVETTGSESAIRNYERVLDRYHGRGSGGYRSYDPREQRAVEAGLGQTEADAAEDRRRKAVEWFENTIQMSREQRDRDRIQQAQQFQIEMSNMGREYDWAKELWRQDLDDYRRAGEYAAEQRNPRYQFDYEKYKGNIKHFENAYDEAVKQYAAKGVTGTELQERAYRDAHESMMNYVSKTGGGVEQLMMLLGNLRGGGYPGR